jgi:hypothetical protein
MERHKNDQSQCVSQFSHHCDRIPGINLKGGNIYFAHCFGLSWWGEDGRAEQFTSWRPGKQEGNETRYNFKAALLVTFFLQQGPTSKVSSSPQNSPPSWGAGV